MELEKLTEAKNPSERLSILNEATDYIEKTLTERRNSGVVFADCEIGILYEIGKLQTLIRSETRKYTDNMKSAIDEMKELAGKERSFHKVPPEYIEALEHDGYIAVKNPIDDSVTIYKHL